MKFGSFALLLAPALFGSDTILIHGHIYTESPKAPSVEAISISGSRIDALGSDHKISRRKGAQTKVI